MHDNFESCLNKYIGSQNNSIFEKDIFTGSIGIDKFEFVAAWTDDGDPLQLFQIKCGPFPSER